MSLSVRGVVEANVGEIDDLASPKGSKAEVDDV